MLIGDTLDMSEYRDQDICVRYRSRERNCDPTPYRDESCSSNQPTLKVDETTIRQDGKTGTITITEKVFTDWAGDYYTTGYIIKPERTFDGNVWSVQKFRCNTTTSWLVSENTGCKFQTTIPFTTNGAGSSEADKEIVQVLIPWFDVLLRSIADDPNQAYTYNGSSQIRSLAYFIENFKEISPRYHPTQE